MRDFKVKVFTPEGKEFLGIKAGQDYYKKIRKELSPDVNRICFPEDAEILPSFIRGLYGQRDENTYFSLKCPNEKTQELLDKCVKDFDGIRGDTDWIDFGAKKKKK